MKQGYMIILTIPEVAPPETTIKIMPSGWGGMHHVIIEDPGMGDYGYEHELVNNSTLVQRFGMFAHDIYEYLDEVARRKATGESF